jgi:splicing factor U2AF subunit
LKEAIKHFEDFYEEVFLELAKFGEIQDMNVSDNLGDHLIGNVYVKYSTIEEAEMALKAMNGRFYAGKAIEGEYSPVTDFGNSRCKQFEESSCRRGGLCNFMHVKYISKTFKGSLIKQMYSEHPEYKDKKKNKLRRKCSDDDGDCKY